MPQKKHPHEGGQQSDCARHFTTPPTESPIIADRPLEVLAAEINLAHREARNYAGKAIERALQAGDLLLTVKSQLNHGEFSPWCTANCPDISRRTIQNYMRVARELPAEKRTDAHLGLNQALRLIASAEEDEEDSSANLLPGPDPFVLPWRRTADKTKVATTVREYPDLLMGAATYLDADGKEIPDIAAELGVFVEELEPVLNPLIPPINFYPDDYPAEAIKECHRRAHRLIYGAQASAAHMAWCWAEFSERADLADQFRAEERQARKAKNRIKTNDLDLWSMFIGRWMGQAALGLIYLPHKGLEISLHAIDSILALFDYEFFEVMPEWGKIVDKMPESLKKYYKRQQKIIDSIKIPTARLGTATLEELQQEKSELWERRTDILHARGGAE